MSNPPLIDMENVRVRYGRHEVFSGLTLTLPNDQSSAVIGPNGSGKSTLLKLIFRDHYHDENEFSHFRVLGQKSRERDQLRMRMGLVSHELQSRVDKNSTVFDVVISQYYSSLATYAHQTYTDEQIDIAMSHLEFMGVQHLANSKFVGVSTGEQRRCLLARALIHDPEYLILDEPTSGLDIKATHQYLESMSKLIKTGKKVVLVTHHLHEILPEIDYFVFLRNGELVDKGNRKKMLTNKKISNLFEIPIKINQDNGALTANVISG